MGMLSIFDFADPNLMAGARQKTTVPAQALFLMNSEFSYEQSRALAARLLGNTTLADDSVRINRLFSFVFGRQATAEEQELVMEYLTGKGITDETQRSETWTSLCLAMFGSNEFLFQD